MPDSSTPKPDRVRLFQAVDDGVSEADRRAESVQRADDFVRGTPKGGPSPNRAPDLPLTG